MGGYRGEGQTKAPKSPPPYSTAELPSPPTDNSSYTSAQETGFFYRSRDVIDNEDQVLGSFFEEYGINLNTFHGDWTSYDNKLAQSYPFAIIEFHCPHNDYECCRAEYDVLERDQSRILIGTLQQITYGRWRPRVALANLCRGLVWPGESESSLKRYTVKTHSYHDADLQHLEKPESLTGFKRLMFKNPSTVKPRLR